MIVEIRTYTFKTGRMAEWAELYETTALACQAEHLGRCAGHYVTDVGPLNQLVHIWLYDSYEDRARRRAAMYADPRFKAYAAQLREHDMLLAQESKVMVSTPFFTPAAGTLGRT